ncbi:MAG: hypothetical protein VYA34_02700 [Myxococcota bacterium]|nr:hypothetical protein [Myxococcota bacterium]
MAREWLFLRLWPIYVKQSREHVELMVEHFQKQCPRWKAEPGLLKILGDINRLSGNKGESVRYYTESRQLCECVLAEVSAF